jgi:tellurite resistance protein
MGVDGPFACGFNAANAPFVGDFLHVPVLATAKMPRHAEMVRPVHGVGTFVGRFLGMGMAPAFLWAVAVGIVAWLVRRIVKAHRARIAVPTRPILVKRPIPEPSPRAALVVTPVVFAPKSAPVRNVSTPLTARTTESPPAPRTAPAVAPVLVAVRMPEPPPTARAGLAIPPVLPVRWITEHETVSIGGVAIRGGLFYSGALSKSSAYEDEPCTIDPTLPVADFSTYATWTASYWPQYRACSMADRRSLLSWLADGRKDPHAPIGLVFLYFYGLERRLLDDARTLDAARQEVPRLVAEIDRLRRIYDHASFQQYAGALRDLAIAMYGDPGRIRDFSGCRPGNEPSALLVALGRQLADGKTLSPSLAYAWARTLDGAPRPAIVMAVAEELRTLFEKRYLTRYRQGLVVSRPKRKLVVEHRGAALNRINMRLAFDVPDVRTITAPQRPLAELLEACVNDLQLLIKARRRDIVDPLEVAAAMPAELGSGAVSDQLAGLKTFVERMLADKPTGTASVDDLLLAISFDTAAKVRKRDCVVLASALERLGYGIEPDVRWLGPTLCRGGRVALYRCEPAAAQTPSSNYRIAQLFMHMAVAVAAADDNIDEAELQHARRHIDELADLDASERTRLGAHLVWLTTTKPSLAKLLSQLKTLSTDQRRAVAEAAIGVAAADGRIDPDEMRTLERIYRALNLPESEVAADVHRAMTGSVTPRAPATVALDSAALARKIEETADVQKLLTSIFVDEDLASIATHTVVMADGVQKPAETLASADDDAIESLDRTHSILMRRLLDESGDVVARDRVDAWCRELGLMPDGALESLNEAAYALAGDALFDVDDDVFVRPDVKEQLKSMIQGVAA